MIDLLTVIKQHYPFAAPSLVSSTLGASDLSLFLLAMAAAIVLLPCAFGDQVDEIARRHRNHDDH